MQALLKQTTFDKEKVILCYDKKQCPAKPLGEAWAHIIMYFAYILQSKKDKSYYTGATEHLQKRIKEHNTNQAKYSSSKTPYVLRWFCAFPTKQKALAFEQYLKSHSGIAFRNKRLV